MKKLINQVLFGYISARKQYLYYGATVKPHRREYLMTRAKVFTIGDVHMSRVFNQCIRKNGTVKVYSQRKVVIHFRRIHCTVREMKLFFFSI